MRLAALLLSLLQPILAITSNRTVIGELLILDGHPRGRRAVLVNDNPHEPCRIYGHRYVDILRLITIHCNASSEKSILVIQFKLLKIFQWVQLYGRLIKRNGR